MCSQRKEGWFFLNHREYHCLYILLTGPLQLLGFQRLVFGFWHYLHPNYNYKNTVGAWGISSVHQVHCLHHRRVRQSLFRHFCPSPHFFKGLGLWLNKFDSICRRKDWRHEKPQPKWVVRDSFILLAYCFGMWLPLITVLQRLITLCVICCDYPTWNLCTVLIKTWKDSALKLKNSLWQKIMQWKPATPHMQQLETSSRVGLWHFFLKSGEEYGILKINLQVQLPA